MSVARYRIMHYPEDNHYYIERPCDDVHVYYHHFKQDTGEFDVGQKVNYDSIRDEVTKGTFRFFNNLFTENEAIDFIESLT